MKSFYLITAECNRIGKEMGDHVKLNFMIEQQANNLLEAMHDAAYVNKVENVDNKKINYFELKC